MHMHGDNVVPSVQKCHEMIMIAGQVANKIML